MHCLPCRAEVVRLVAAALQDGALCHAESNLTCLNGIALAASCHCTLSADLWLAVQHWHGLCRLQGIAQDDSGINRGA